MENFRDLFEKQKLDDIDATLTRQIDSLPTGYYDAKLAVMLSMMVTKGVEKLDKIDGTSFPSELNDKFNAIRKLYEERVVIFRRHLNENAAIIRAIEKADTDYPELERKITELLSEFDALLAVKIKERDNTPVAGL